METNHRETQQGGNRSVSRAARARALDVAYVGMAAAVLTVCSWISVPLPKPLVSFTMQTFAVALVAGLLGVRRGTAAVAVWLALGALGVPVFAGFNGGIGYMLGSTGGYLWGFLLWVPIEGLLYRVGRGKLPLLAVGMAGGLAVCYTFGTVWFMVVYARTTGPVALSTVLSWCVLPYLVPDAVKLAMAVPLIRKGRKWLKA